MGNTLPGCWLMSGMGGMLRTGRGRERARAEIAVVRVLEKRLGALPVVALPVVAEFGRRLRIAEIVDELCPVRPLAWITHGEVIEALIANRLTAPAPMLRVTDWAAAMAVEEAYGIAPELPAMTGSPARWTRSRRSWMRSPAGWGRRRSPSSVLMCPGCTGI
jgi:hypothetical protein